MVSFWFPPTNLMGAVRVGKFAKYLPDYGWQPFILTGDKVSVARGTTATLPVELAETIISRTHYFSVADFVMSHLLFEREPTADGSLPSPRWSTSIRNHLVSSVRSIYHLPVLKAITVDPVGWFPFAVKRGLEIIRNCHIDAIFSSFGPSTSHFVASYLHSKTGIPWIADFRDLWSQHPYYPKSQPFHWLEGQIERRALRDCARLIAVSEPMARQMESLHHRRVEVIPNGFDDADYCSDVPLVPKFTVTFTGHVRAQEIISLGILFEAVAELYRAKSISADNFEIRFYGGSLAGNIPTQLVSLLADKLGISGLIRIRGAISYAESVRRQKESTVLLVLLPIDHAAKGIYSGKIFEYLGAARPIIAIAPKEGVVDLLLKETGAGVVASDQYGVRLLFSQWVREFQGQGHLTSFYSPRREVIANYTRRELTGRLAEVLDEAVGS